MKRVHPSAGVKLYQEAVAAQVVVAPSQNEKRVSFIQS